MITTLAPGKSPVMASMRLRVFETARGMSATTSMGRGITRGAADDDDAAADDDDDSGASDVDVDANGRVVSGADDGAFI